MIGTKPQTGQYKGGVLLRCVTSVTYHATLLSHLVSLHNLSHHLGLTLLLAEARVFSGENADPAKEKEKETLSTARKGPIPRALCNNNFEV